jgi:hypothetical protein
MADITPGDLAERIAKLDEALREAKELQRELRQKMAARARNDQQAVSNDGTTTPATVRIRR